VQELQEQFDKINPKLIIDVIKLFEDEKHRATLVKKTLECLRNEQIDIRVFPDLHLA